MPFTDPHDIGGSDMTRGWFSRLLDRIIRLLRR